MVDYNKWYYHNAYGYIYDKRIFFCIIGAIILLALNVVNNHNFDFSPKLYFVCEGSFFNSTACPNPFIGSDMSKYCKYDWCKNEVLAPGEYGEKPPKDLVYNNFGLICFCMALFGLVINHIIHNWGVMPKLKLNMPDKWADWIKKSLNQIEDEEDENEKPKDNSEN